MKSTIIAIATLVAAAAAESIGYVSVVNSCSDTVYIVNTPSDDGVHKEELATLQNGDSYSQQYTALTNGAGWSLKMAYDASMYSGDIQQFEYTFQNEGDIWYDMSDVNGAPFSSWAFSSNDAACKQTGNAFTDPTTADGMQANCTQTANITMTLCTDDSSSASSSSAYSSVAVSTVSSYTASSSTASPTSTSTPSAYIAESKTQGHTWGQVDAVASTTSVSSPSTTLATSVITSAASTSDSGDVVWVTDIAYTTEYVTAAKRDVHHHQHHARHPHGVRA